MGERTRIPPPEPPEHAPAGPAPAAERGGFERRFGKGDHWIYRHPRTGRQFTVDPRNPLLPVYVGLAIQAIEEVLSDEDG